MRLLDALQTEFGKQIRVMLDTAPYFAANDVHDYVEIHRFFEELAVPRETVFDSIEPIEEPETYNYLCPSV